MSNKITRRDLLKGLATFPVAGSLLVGSLQKEKYYREKANSLSRIIDLNFSGFNHPLPDEKTSKKIRLGIIGCGLRGSMIMNSIGFASPDEILDIREASMKDKNDKRYEFFMNTERLNIEFKGVCDLFDPYAERAMIAAANSDKRHIKSNLTPVKRYPNCKDLIAAEDIDGVIIATPDHWHASMIIEAAKKGKHVYAEKCMTRTLEEAYKVKNAVEASGITFQLGHQNRQFDSYNLARDLVTNKEILGRVNLIQCNTNRNTEQGAWIYPIPENAGRHNIDWEQFIAATEPADFSLERFFRWRLWWDYGTGLAGDMLTHEYDCINQVLNVGIPDSVQASGGIYHFRDDREVPDVFNALLEYREKKLTLMYSASLANGKYRPRTLMGTDATMELSNGFTVTIDTHSQKYGDQIEQGLIDTEHPAYSYSPGSEKVDTITSASTKYFAQRGLIYTYRQGKALDTTYLHVKEWLDALRTHNQPSCNIHRGFEEAVTAHMATRSYREGKKVFFDRDSEKVVL